MSDDDVGLVQRLRSDGAAYGPPTGLPLIVGFLSVMGYSVKLVAVTAMVSFAAILLAYAMIRADRPTRVHAVLSILAAVFVASIALTHWPLRMIFRIAQSNLETMATVVSTGGTVEFERAGLFVIREGRMDDGDVILEIAGNRYDNCAFVKSAQSVNKDDYNLGNQWSHRSLK